MSNYQVLQKQFTSDGILHLKVKRGRKIRIVEVRASVFPENQKAWVFVRRNTKPDYTEFLSHDKPVVISVKRPLLAWNETYSVAVQHLDRQRFQTSLVSIVYEEMIDEIYQNPTTDIIDLKTTNNNKAL